MAQRETARTTYHYLVERPHPWRRQLSLRGRNITVGQFIASMRANNLSPEVAADNFDVPLAQVMEVLAYYAAHHSLVDEELREDKRRLRVKGYVIEPPSVPR